MHTVVRVNGGNPVGMDLRDVAPLYGPGDLDPLLARIGRARFVLVGAASHGTAEFHRWRAELTKRLVAERGFDFVGVDGDWADCHRLHCCVAGAPGMPNDPAAVLWGLRRWPRWLWANEEVVDFAAWLREFSARRRRPVGFHGLDVHGRWPAPHEVEPDRAAAALAAFDPDRAGAPVDVSEDDLVRLLARPRSRTEPASLPGLDPAFAAWLNADTGGQRYYRDLVRGGDRAWDVRERHLADTLDRLADAYGPGTKAVVWAHNTHVGDVRATEPAPGGRTNLGRLVRERHGAENTVLVGFGTYAGSVIAADRWAGEPRRLPVPPAAPDSVESRWHEAMPDVDSMAVFPPDGGPAWARELRGHRSIGVVYAGVGPGDHVRTALRPRYDAFVHCDRSTALTPLHRMEIVTHELERQG
jgi:erythromycin esterase